MFRGRNCLGAERVSQLILGLKVSPDWKFLPAESFLGLQVSQGWNCRNWKCLMAESVSHLHGWKCLAAENVWAANFSQLKVSQGWKCLLDHQLSVSRFRKVLSRKIFLSAPCRKHTPGAHMFFYLSETYIITVATIALTNPLKERYSVAALIDFSYPIFFAYRLSLVNQLRRYYGAWIVAIMWTTLCSLGACLLMLQGFHPQLLSWEVWNL